MTSLLPVGLSSALLGIPLLLCSSCAEQEMTDLDTFIAQKQAAPGGFIEPIPAFEPYEAFAYSSATLRSPFDRPIDIRPLAARSARAALRPDPNRSKQMLERFTLDSLMMVGSLQRNGQDWTLIKDPEGGIHRVQVDDFLGRDHGRVVDMGATFIAVIEIVSDGTDDGWAKRPRTIELSGM